MAAGAGAFVAADDGALAALAEVVSIGAGATTKRRLAHVLAPGEKVMDVKKPVDLKLLPGEMRQTVVQIERNGKDRAVYAVEVSHESAKGKPIGGLTILFVPPHDYF